MSDNKSASSAAFPRTASVLRDWLIDLFRKQAPKNAAATILMFLLARPRLDWMDYLLVFPAMVGRRAGAWNDPAAYSRAHGRAYDAPDEFYLAVTRNLAIKLAKADEKLPRGLPLNIRDWLAVKRPEANHNTQAALLLVPNGAGIVKLVATDKQNTTRRSVFSPSVLAKELWAPAQTAQQLKARFLACPWDLENLVDLARRAEEIIALVDDEERRHIGREIERWAAEYRRAEGTLGEYIKYLRLEQFGRIEPMEKQESKVWRFLKCPSHAVASRRQKWLANADRLLAALEVFAIPGEESLARKLQKIERLGHGIIRHADVKALFDSIGYAAKAEIRRKASSFGMDSERALAHFEDESKGDSNAFKVLPEVFLLCCEDPVHWQEEGKENKLLADRKEVAGILHLPDKEFARRFGTIAGRRVAGQFFHQLPFGSQLQDFESASRAAAAKLQKEPDANRPFRIDDDPAKKTI